MAESRRMPETRDVWPGTLLAFVAGLVVFLAVALVALNVIFDARPDWPQPGAAQTSNEASPALQRAPGEDFAAFRQKKEAELAAIGWVDKANGVARIPIQDAMRIVAEKGLPHWPAQGAAASAQLSQECRTLLATVPRSPQAQRCLAGQPPSPQQEPSR